MARTENQKAVVEIFSKLPFDEQMAVLVKLNQAMEETRRHTIAVLQKQLSVLTAQDNGKGFPVERSARPAEKSVSTPIAAKKQHPATGVKVPPKYRHPETKETWTGRGVHPKWMRKYLEEGGQIENLLIKKGGKRK